MPHKKARTEACVEVQSSPTNVGCGDEWAAQGQVADSTMHDGQVTPETDAADPHTTALRADDLQKALEENTRLDPDEIHDVAAILEAVWGASAMKSC